MGRRKLVEDAPVRRVSLQISITLSPHMQCFEILNAFISQGGNEIDTAFM